MAARKQPLYTDLMRMEKPKWSLQIWEADDYGKKTFMYGARRISYNEQRSRSFCLHRMYGFHKHIYNYLLQDPACQAAALWIQVRALRDETES